MDFSGIVIYLSLFISLYFEVFLFISFFEIEKNGKNKIKPLIKNDVHLPSATIIVPCWNEERTVAGTIQSLLKLNYPKDKLKIVVVDDGSTDNTLKEAKKFENKAQVTIFSKENGGKHTAMNLALENCDTDLIGCLDADSFVDPDALMHFAPYFTDKKVAAVTPGMRVHNAKTFIQYMQKAEYTMSILLRRVFAHIGSIFITPGPFSIFRTDAIRSVGPWRKAHGTEDLEMGIRLQKAHYKIENEPDAKVLTTTPDTIKKLYKQRVRWTHGFLRNAWDYREMFFSKEYGNLGVLILPLAIISVVMSLAVFAITIESILSIIGKKILSIFDTGITVPSYTHPSIFYLNTTALSFIILVVFISTLTLMLIGKRIAREKNYIGRDILAYFTIYGFIAPIWLTGATIKALARTGTKWR